MWPITELQESGVYLIARLFLGILFFSQGYDKLFNVKLSGVILYFKEITIERNIPGFILSGAAFFSTFSEFFGGLLLILGLFKIPVLFLLSADILLVSIAFSVVKPMWDMQFILPRLLLILFLLLLPLAWDRFSLDYLFAG